MAAAGVVRIEPEKPSDVIPQSPPASTRNGVRRFRVLVAFQALEIRAHDRGPPRIVPQEIREIVPIGIRAGDRDHRVMNGATTEGRRAWIEDSATVVLRVGGLCRIRVRRRIGVMLNEKTPA